MMATYTRTRVLSFLTQQPDAPDNGAGAAVCIMDRLEEFVGLAQKACRSAWRRQLGFESLVRCQGNGPRVGAQRENFFGECFDKRFPCCIFQTVRAQKRGRCRMSEVGRARCLIAGALVCALSWPVWGADNYEPNDDYAAAYDLTTDAGTPLLSISGLADTSSSDDDWYEIYVDAGYENVVISCSFVHASGDIDIELYDENLTLEAYSDSRTDDEMIDIRLPPGGGTYYIWVYSQDSGANDYDLLWEELQPLDDTYEDNDTLGTAYDLSGDEDTWLSTIDGWAVSADDDWYAIYVTAGFERVIIDCDFVHAYGDIDIELYDDTGALVDEAFSMTDDERIDCVVGQADAYYYVLVYEFGSSGNLYDLKWLTATPPDDDGTTTIICGQASDSSGFGAALAAALLVGGAAVLRRRRAAEAA